MTLDRNFGETHGGLAIIAPLQGDSETAEHFIKYALKLEPISTTGQYAQILLMQAKGQTDKAKKLNLYLMQRSILLVGSSLIQLILKKTAK